MKKRILLLALMITTIFCLSACGKEEVIDEPVLSIPKHFEASEEIINTNINDGKFQYCGNVIEIGSKLRLLLETSDAKITKDFGSRILETTFLKPGENGSVDVTTNGENILTIYIYNDTDIKQYPAGCTITGVYYYNTNNEKINNEQYGMAHFPGGISLSEKENKFTEYLSNYKSENNKKVLSETNVIAYYKTDSYAFTIVYDEDSKVINQIKYSIR